MITYVHICRCASYPGLPDGCYLMQDPGACSVL